MKSKTNTPGHVHGFQVKGSFKRAIQEYHYFTCKGWPLKDVGDFWDSVTDYDDINESTYSYYRRFTNSWQLARSYLDGKYIVCDVQARSGKGTDFWHQKGYVEKSFLVDFSDFLLSIADTRLKNTDCNYELVKMSKYNLPFEKEFFDLLLCYETIEHIGDPLAFMQEITRVLKNDGLMILTCPNILWEPVHWISAIFNIHHSEGPHNFLRRSKLIQLFETCGLDILEENTTVLMPFNNNFSIKLDKYLEANVPENIKRIFALRRSYILSKTH